MMEQADSVNLESQIMPDTIHVSITGLQIRHLWHLPMFWRHAISAMMQAQSADGCLSAEARTIHGIHHTRSVWRDRDAMQSYLRQGAHLSAMSVFGRIATGKTLGYETSEIPNWDEVHLLWKTEGRNVSG